MSNHLLFITGLSGAGMSSALKILEDVGYEVLDNFPLTLLDPLLDEENQKPIAIGIDSRTRRFSPEDLIKAIQIYKAKLIFITCDESTLQSRFSETRRRHPLAQDRTVADGIEKEKELLSPLLEAADLVIDTTNLSIHDLKQQIESEFDSEFSQALNINLLSFGYKNGIPRDADIIFDVRFLKNPHWVQELKPLTGQNQKVASYIAADENFETFFSNLKTLIEPLLPAYQKEGKSYLTIAIGCTGGKHRSVFTVEKLNEWLRSLGQEPFIKHRDMPIE
ncbi:MAG: RNase adapter RapZ [Pseudomonadota bacterium]